MSYEVRGHATRALIVLGAALLLAACSFTKLAYMNAALAYDNATPVLAWLVDDYVDLSGTQKGWVRERLQRAMSWHRSQELPEYRRFVESVSDRAEDGISAGEARQIHGALRAYYHRALGHLVPDVADFLLQLDAEQIAHLERKFANDNKKVVRESTKGTPRARMDTRIEKFLTHIEEFTGHLDGTQRDLVVGTLRDLGELTDERLGERRFRQGEILALVRSKPPREQAIATLQRVLVEPDSWRREDYQRKLRERDEKLFAMVASLSASLTADQRTHLRVRLHGLIRDITQLTARAS